MHSVFVYFKTRRADRDAVRRACTSSALAFARQHACSVSCSMRHESESGGVESAGVDTWLEHYRCPADANIDALAAAIRDDSVSTALMSFITAGSGGRHLEVFTEFPLDEG